MRCKKHEEKIVLNLYGELNEKEKEELEAHIKECTSCAEDLAYTKEVFHILDEAREEEVPEVEWEKSWQKIDTAIPETPQKEKRFFLFPRWAYGAASLAAVFILGIVIGRFLFFPGQPAGLQTAASENYLQYTLNEHFDELKPILIEYANYTSSEKGEESIVMDKEVARNLILQNFLLKRMVAKTNPSAAQLLEDVDLVLREIANLRKEDKQTPSLIKDLIHQRGILFKIGIQKTI